MKRPHVVLLIAFAMISPTTSAEISIEELIRQSGLTDGPIAVRELPRWSGAQKILVTRLADSDVDALSQSLPETEFVTAISEEDALQKVRDVEAILGMCSEPLVTAAEKLVWIQIFSSGAERCLSVNRVANGEVILTNMQKMSAPVIGEHAIAMALALARRLPLFARRMQTGSWSRASDTTSSMVSLSGKTMLVIGLGGIGIEAARRAAALGMQVIGTRNSSRDGPPFVKYVGLSDELLELAGEADVIVNALPLTTATRGLLGTAFFDATKEGALFVNVGRGATVDTEALIAALRNGKIGGAGLDVTDPEPLPADHPMWQFDNVIITPHVAARGGKRERHRTLLIENLRRYAAGGRLLNVVDPEKGY